MEGESRGRKKEIMRSMGERGGGSKGWGIYIVRRKTEKAAERKTQKKKKEDGNREEINILKGEKV